MTTDQCFRTNDMTLVAFLATRHLSHSAMEYDGDEAQWVLPLSVALERELDMFRQGEAEVEPVRFAQQLVRTRKELFRYLEDQQRVA
jgi:hypothetical protein